MPRGPVHGLINIIPMQKWNLMGIPRWRKVYKYSSSFVHIFSQLNMKMEQNHIGKNIPTAVHFSFGGIEKKNNLMEHKKVGHINEPKILASDHPVLQYQ